MGKKKTVRQPSPTHSQVPVQQNYNQVINSGAAPRVESQYIMEDRREPSPRRPLPQQPMNPNMHTGYVPPPTTSYPAQPFSNHGYAPSVTSYPLPHQGSNQTIYAPPDPALTYTDYNMQNKIDQVMDNPISVYGMPMQPLRARKATVRHIPLTPEGNLVIDIPVPDRVLYSAKYQNGDEFTHMRYTAVTCSADEFPTRGYSLRQQESKRHTELFIVVTMYNEDDFLFCKSMTALMKNIAYLCSRNRSSMYFFLFSSVFISFTY